MYTEHYYVIVTKYIEQSFKNSGRTYRLLWVRCPKSWDKLCFRISKSIKIPIINSGDKVRLKLHFFTRGRSDKPDFTISAIEKIEE